MLAGALYRAGDPELSEKRARARSLLARLAGGDRSVAAELFGGIGDEVEIVPPFFCDYGSNIFVGSRVFMNTGGVILDCARVDIGDDVQMGPGVHLYTATHPVGVALRRTGLERAEPISIGADVWLGGRVVVCPGVSVGDGSAICAGSVVVRDIPARVVAAGNPCRVIRTIDAADEVPPPGSGVS